MEYWSLNLDELAESLPEVLASKQDGVAGHYARFTGTCDECVEKAMKIIREYVQMNIYRSVGYGYPYSDELDEED